jgi:23S rRNA (adenine2503-C2)-methyltransferase
MQEIKDLSLEDLKNVLEGWNLPAFHVRQIFFWLYKRGVKDFAQMSDLPLALRNRLKENFSLSELKAAEALQSKDGTKKFIFRLEDGSFIEAVLIPAQGRVTGCISTQAGCKFACHFCASGLAGFKRNLDCAEIIAEILYLKNHSAAKKLTHLVFMGTGEPLDNYDNVMKAIRLINSPETLDIGARRITISTAGVIPGIKRLSQEGLQVELSVSLHAADDKTRSLLMPINKIYSLKDLLAACREYIEKTNRQVTFEYVLIKGINSDLQSAGKLSTILKGLKLAKVNLIPSNPIKELKIEPPVRQDILGFKNYLLRQGINVTLRKSRGEDIEAACGQLRLRYEKK